MTRGFRRLPWCSRYQFIHKGTDGKTEIAVKREKGDPVRPRFFQEACAKPRTRWLGFSIGDGMSSPMRLYASALQECQRGCGIALERSSANGVNVWASGPLYSSPPSASHPSALRAMSRADSTKRCPSSERCENPSTILLALADPTERSRTIDVGPLNASSGSIP